MYRPIERRASAAEGELRQAHGRPAVISEEDSARMMRRALVGSCDSARTLARFVERLSPTEAAALRAALRERLEG